MTHTPSVANLTSRRGAALLIVLATLVVAVTACATLARITATAAAERRLHTRSLAAAELLRGTDAPIHHWLDSKSAIVVLPPDSPIAELSVLHDAWTTDDEVVEVRITAYDQCGMLPADSASSPLRSTIPPKVARALSDTKLPRAGEFPLGLDLFTGEAERNGLALFPAPTPVPAAPFGEATIPPTSMPPRDVQSAPAIGAWIATHNAPRILNVNTAPASLLVAALRAAGRGGLEQILDARSRNIPASVPPPARGNAGRSLAPTLAPSLASSSISWAFRIDVRVGFVEQSQWSVYVRDSEHWRCVQRLVIDR